MNVAVEAVNFLEKGTERKSIGQEVGGGGLQINIDRKTIREGGSERDAESLFSHASSMAAQIAYNSA